MPDPSRPARALLERFEALDVSYGDLWAHCIQIGGPNMGRAELDAYLHDALEPSDEVLLVVQHALWELERFGP